MGSNSSKKTKETKIHEPDSEVTKEVRQQKKRHDHLKNPDNDRPIQLSWLQQNNMNDNYNQIHQHHEIRSDEQPHRIPLAINRWPKDNNQIKEQKSKSFIEEYIHQ